MHVTVVSVCLFVLLGSCPYWSNANVVGRDENALTLGRKSLYQSAKHSIARQIDEEDEDGDEDVNDYVNNANVHKFSSSYYQQAQQAVVKDHGQDAVEDEEENAEQESEEFHQSSNNQGSAPLPNDGNEEDCNGDDEECDGGGVGHPGDEEGYGEGDEEGIEAGDEE